MPEKIVTEEEDREKHMSECVEKLTKLTEIYLDDLKSRWFKPEILISVIEMLSDTLKYKDIDNKTKIITFTAMLETRMLDSDLLDVNISNTDFNVNKRKDCPSLLDRIKNDNKYAASINFLKNVAFALSSVIFIPVIRAFMGKNVFEPTKSLDASTKFLDASAESIEARDKMRDQIDKLRSEKIRPDDGAPKPK